MIITLLFQYIKHDVHQLTHRYAESRTEDPDVKDIAQLDDNTSDKQLVMRYCLTGTARLRRILKEYITYKTEDANDTLPQDKQSWSFAFKDDLDEADAHAMAELMHWFVVKFCLWEWMKMFGSPSDIKAAGDDVTSLEEDLKDMTGQFAMPMKERRTQYSETDEVTYTYIPE